MHNPLIRPHLHCSLVDLHKTSAHIVRSYVMRPAPHVHAYIYSHLSTLSLQPEDPYQPSAHLVCSYMAQWRAAMAEADKCARVRASEQGGVAGGGDVAEGPHLLDFAAQERDRTMGELVIRCGPHWCGRCVDDIEAQC